MSGNPFGEAMDEAEGKENTEQTDESDGASDGFLGQLDSEAGPKDKTIGFGATEEAHALYRELQNSDEVATDVADSLRDHLAKLARRHPDVAERAEKKLKIDRGEL